jgi:hypothetical protein
MEVIQGGDGWDCIGFGLGAVSLAFAIASVPVSGPIGVSLAVGLATGTFGTGISGGSCLYGMISR